MDALWASHCPSTVNRSKLGAEPGQQFVYELRKKDRTSKVMHKYVFLIEKIERIQLLAFL